MTPFFLAAFLAAQVPDTCAAIFPFEAGRSWGYSGQALWAGPGASGPDSGPVEWEMAVVRVRDVPGGRIGLIRGFVQDLAWYQPGTVPRLSILACYGAELRLATFADDPAAEWAYAQWSDSLASGAELWLALPLREGQVLGQVAPREDVMYGWLVGTPEAPITIPDSCPRPAGPRYELAYRSLPDHRIAEWQPGLGVTRFVYGHHGTPASADVRLVACSGQGEG
ncbi:MAG TPA: hypothetical protein VFO06_03900 [Gemmatimonadales bacterium]|nr:hypothetical protein [Gemmatimonadales bacterium]